MNLTVKMMERIVSHTRIDSDIDALPSNVVSRQQCGIAPRELRESETWQAQLQRDPGSQGPYEGAFQQRLRFLTESQRREADDIGHLDDKINQLRHEFQESMSECAMNVQEIRQEMRSRGQALDRLFHKGRQTYE